MVVEALTGTTGAKVVKVDTAAEHSWPGEVWAREEIGNAGFPSVATGTVWATEETPKAGFPTVVTGNCFKSCSFRK